MASKISRSDISRFLFMGLPKKYMIQRITQICLSIPRQVLLNTVETLKEE